MCEATRLIIATPLAGQTSPLPERLGAAGECVPTSAPMDKAITDASSTRNNNATFPKASCKPHQAVPAFPPLPQQKDQANTGRRV
ncbi:hypothetical protein MAPG_09578 [Magnaporthiopsis poae ATCC 64411]|uniref:Uncharacterized protein n=1 Tax=Magnaporthiopsis poae (strain ATCC 64411 / 73-15) TaxID=644358 RepID=A0A0C4EAB4_MAGP6|nr:hypothetical protein MAPG_09578 [Magnaporthiopsis poae ATCC 64411]